MLFVGQAAYLLKRISYRRSDMSWVQVGAYVVLLLSQVRHLDGLHVMQPGDATTTGRLPTYSKNAGYVARNGLATYNGSVAEAIQAGRRGYVYRIRNFLPSTLAEDLHQELKDSFETKRIENETERSAFLYTTNSAGSNAKTRSNENWAQRRQASNQVRPCGLLLLLLLAPPSAAQGWHVLNQACRRCGGEVVVSTQSCPRLARPEP
ncbi:hypothetical protein CYMTET_6019, partial [Cymbomonas tetramitiformis]